MLKFFPVCFMTIICCACAAHEPEMESRNLSNPVVSKNCPNLYVLAPANCIIELAADSNVILDPGWHDFVLYCSPDKAGNALDKMVKSGTAHKGDWSVYMLDETSEDLVKMENGRMILASPARLKTWLEIEG